MHLHSKTHAKYNLDICQIIWAFSGSSRHFAHYLNTLHIIGTSFRSLTPFSDHRDTFQVIRSVKTLFISSKHFSGYFADHLDTFQIIRTFFRSSRNFSDNPNTFQITWIIKTLFISSSHFSDYLITFKTIRMFWMLQILSKYSGHPAG